MKHIIFKLNSPTDTSLISTIEDRLWFKVCFFASSKAFLFFKLKYGNTDVGRKLIEESYDLSNSKPWEIQRGGYLNNRRKENNWVMLEKHLPKE